MTGFWTGIRRQAVTKRYCVEVWDEIRGWHADINDCNRELWDARTRLLRYQSEGEKARLIDSFGGVLDQ
jgi:hypothetical protein